MMSTNMRAATARMANASLARVLLPTKNLVKSRVPIPTPRGIGFENAPTEILIGGGVFLTATIAFIASQAMGMAGAPTPSLEPTYVEEADPILPREDAVIVFGASGRSGRQIVSKLLASGRTVVAAVRDRTNALEIFGAQGVTEGRNGNGVY